MVILLGFNTESVSLKVFGGKFLMFVHLSNLIFSPQQVKAAVVDRGANKVHPMVSNTKVQITKPENHPRRYKSRGTSGKYKDHILYINVSNVLYWLMVKHMGRVVNIKILCVQYVFKLIHALQSIVHMSCQVTVQKTQHVTVERETHRHGTFITLERINTNIKCTLDFWDNVRTRQQNT